MEKGGASDWLFPLRLSGGNTFLHCFPQRIDAFGAALDGRLAGARIASRNGFFAAFAEAALESIPPPPIPTALLLITTESVPAGTIRSVVEEAESTSALRAPAPTGGLEPVCHPWVRAAPCSETGFPEACWVVGVMLRSVSARCITGSATHLERQRPS